MSNVDKKARKSFCLQSRMYRIKQNRSGKINFICDSNIDKHNGKFRINNKDIFEFYPYKPYLFFRLKWSIAKIMESKSVKKIKNFNAWSLFTKITVLVAFAASLIAIYEFMVKPNIE